MLIISLCYSCCTAKNTGNEYKIINEETAIELAKEKMINIYGSSFINKFNPYEATLINNTWYVKGFVEKKKIVDGNIVIYSGGIPKAEVNAKTKEVYIPEIGE